MLDLALLRKDPKIFKKNLALRGFELNIEEFYKLDKEYRNAQNKLDILLNKKKLLAEKHDNKDDKEEAIRLKDEIEGIKGITTQYKKRLNDFLLLIPNILINSVPIGLSEKDNVVVFESKIKPNNFNFKIKSHYELATIREEWGDRLAAEISGKRFLYLFGRIARLCRALGQFMCDKHVENGYTEVKVPEIIKSEGLIGSGQLPKFKDDLFALDLKTTDNTHYLIPTAEVPLVNLFRGLILKLDYLPIRLVSLSSCFRSEVGSYGKDTKGIIRQHQFEKVELVHVTKPEDSHDALKEIKKHAAEVLDLLELPYRVIELCSGDIGFSSAQTFDIEVWMPYENRYREISSCSNCLDFQSRRIGAKFKDKNGNKKYLHTLNGSGLAVGRLLAAICENYQTEDSNVKIPRILKKYLPGYMQEYLWDKEINGLIGKL